MKSFTPSQSSALATVQQSVARCNALALKVEALDLPVLATFLREAACMLRAGIEFQERAFRDGTLLEPTEAFLEVSKQVEATADAIQRRGLLK